MKRIGPAHGCNSHKGMSQDHLTTTPASASVSSRILKLLIMLLLILSTPPLMTLLTQNPRAYADDSVEYVVGKVIQYDSGDARTHNMRIDGVAAYCVMPTFEAPPSGNYQKLPFAPEVISADQYKALLWFGWGGPGYDPSMWPDTDWKGEPMTDETCYALCHLIDTYFYFSKWGYTASNCLGSKMKDWIREKIVFLRSDGTYTDFSSDTVANRMFARASEVPASFECFTISSGAGKQTIVGFSAISQLKISKSSSNSSLVSNNPLYSLNGISYGVYTDEACTSSIGTITLDENGNSNTLDVSPGTYYVKEDATSCINAGYSADQSVHRIDAVSGKTTTLELEDVPQYCIPDMWLQKTDSSTGSSSPLGAATLKDAEFTASYYARHFNSVEEALASGAPTKQWVISTDNEGHAKFSPESIVSGDDPYLNDAGEMVLPLGTVLIKETKAPVGYRLDSSTTHLIHIASSGTDQTVDSYVSPTHPNELIRGDLKFVKVGDTGMERLSNIPFKLTSKTTGEEHIIVTDENGYYSSSASNIPHTQNTNRNDDADEDSLDGDCGTWFIGSTSYDVAPDDTQGALPYDTYTLEELPCKANERYTLIKLEHISIKRDEQTVDLGTLIDPSKQSQYVTTTAYEPSSLSKLVKAEKQAAVIDSIEYMNLVPGDEYVLQTQLAYASTGDVLTIDGQEMTQERAFIPEAQNGKTSVEMIVDTTDLANSELVFMERLYKDGILLAEDIDPNNTDQMLRVIGPNISTYAHATDSDTKQVPASSSVHITDEVSYSGLSADDEYTLVGMVMNQKDGSLAFTSMSSNSADQSGSLSPVAGTKEQGETFTVTKEAQSFFDKLSALLLQKPITSESKSEDVNDEPVTDEPLEPDEHPTDPADDPTDENADSPEFDLGTSSLNEAIETLGKVDTESLDALFEENTDLLDVIGVAKKSFTAKGEEGSVDMNLCLDASDLEGEEPLDIVVYEFLLKDDSLIAAHMDKDDEAQQMNIFPASIGTVATDEEGLPLAQTGDALKDVKWAALLLPLLALLVFGSRALFAKSQFKAQTSAIRERWRSSILSNIDR